jgi:hypothetical protein
VCAGRRHRYVWGTGQSSAGFLDSLVKQDLETSKAADWSEKDSFPSEPVFVPAPNAGAEDEGVLLSVWCSTAKGSALSFSFSMPRPCGSAREPMRRMSSLSAFTEIIFQTPLSCHPLRGAYLVARTRGAGRSIQRGADVVSTLHRTPRA